MIRPISSLDGCENPGIGHLGYVYMDPYALTIPHALLLNDVGLNLQYLSCVGISQRMILFDLIIRLRFQEIGNQ